MKLDTIIILVSQRREKYWGSKMVAGLLWNATRWPLDDAKNATKRLTENKIKCQGFLKNNPVKCGWGFLGFGGFFLFLI